MAELKQVGLIGAGLMGHGIGKNLLAKGFSLSFLDHPGNQPVDDLLALGARRLPAVMEVTRHAEVVLLCVTGSPQVEDTMFRRDGVLAALRPDQIVVDCSTAEPHVTQRVAAAVAERGARFLDAPLTRTPREAEEGRLNVMVGGDAATLEAVRPLFDTFAENIYHAGAVGAGHTLKLLHNYISLGNCVLLAEAVVCARRGGVDMRTFIDVLSSGGGDSVALRRLAPYVLNRDLGAFRFSLANSRKDLSYYTAMADHHGVPALAAHAIQQVFTLVQALGAGERPVPTLVDLLDHLQVES